MKRLLMVAFQFPPFAGSSGIQRTLRFVQQLPGVGWEPIVLTAHPRAYEAVSEDLLHEIPQGTVVERAFGLDTARHLSLLRRYPAFLARPDRWITWRIGAVRAGLRLVRHYRPQVIWSTYPIATAHLVGADLSRLSRLPWIADFRDPMAQEGYPADHKTWQSFKAIESAALHQAARIIFTTPGAAQLYRDRYPDVPSVRIRTVENGYDEESFIGIESAGPDVAPLIAGKVTLLHSGVIYPSERDPTHLFAALSRLAGSGQLRGDWFRLRLRSPGHESLLTTLIRDYQLGELVEIAPPVPYRQALEEMARADGLVVLQAANCNAQIPAKVYEYLRTRRPILGLTDPAGDTASVLRQAGVTGIARLDSVEAITSALLKFVGQIKAGTAPVPDAHYVAGASRLQRARELANLLAELD
jgi:hypothetical protein